MGLFDAELGRTSGQRGSLFADEFAALDKPPAPSPVTDTAKDVGLSLGQGALNTFIGMPLAAVDAATLALPAPWQQKLGDAGFRPADAQQQLGDWNRQLEAQKSAGYQEAAQQDANAQGFWDTAKVYAQNPIDYALPKLAENAPQLAGSFGIGLAAKGSALAKGLAETEAAKRAVLASHIGEGVQATLGNLQQQRLDNPQGDLQFLPAAAAGIGTGLIGYGASRIPGLGDAESAFFGAANAPKGNMLTRGLKGAVSEGLAEEMPQSAQEQMWQNVAEDKPIMEGVGKAAATGAILGAGLGGPVAALSTPARQPNSPLTNAAHAASPVPPEAPVTPDLDTVTRTSADQLQQQRFATADEAHAAALARGFEPATEFTLTRNDDDTFSFKDYTPHDTTPAQVPQVTPEQPDAPLQNAVSAGGDAGSGTPGALADTGAPGNTGSGISGPDPDAGIGGASRMGVAGAGGTGQADPGEGVDNATPRADAAEQPEQPGQLNQWVFANHPEAILQREQLARQEGISPKDFTISQVPVEDGRNQYILSRNQPVEAAPTDSALQPRDRSTAASVTQMQAIAARPNYDLVGVGTTVDQAAPLVFSPGNHPIMGVNGNEDVAVLPDGQKIPFRYAVMEADQIAASHDVAGNPNPAYAQTPAGMAKALNNGRTAGLQAAYQNGTTDDYKAQLASDTRHGVNPAYIQQMNQPVLVRVYNDAINSAIPDLGARTNQRANAAMGIREQAQLDASRLNDDLADLAVSGDLTHADNADFIRSALDRIAPANEKASLIDRNGKLSQDGEKRLQSALIMRAYNAPDIVSDRFESTDPEIRSIGTALTEAAPDMLKVKAAIGRNEIGASWDISQNVAEAAQLVRQARVEGKPIADYLANQDAFSEGVNPRNIDVLRLMFRDDGFTRQRSQADIASGLRQYARQALLSRNGDVFGETATPEAAVTQVRSNVDNGIKFSFAGTNARTVDRAALAQAEQMEQAYNAANAKLEAIKQTPDYIDGSKKLDDLWSGVFERGDITPEQATAQEAAIFKEYPALAESRKLSETLRQLGGNNRFEDSVNAYKRLAGEAESRLTQRRMNMTPEQRRASFPLDDMRQMLQSDGIDPGTNFENLIVRNGDGKAEMASKPLRRTIVVGNNRNNPAVLTTFEKPVASLGGKVAADRRAARQVQAVVGVARQVFSRLGIGANVKIYASPDELVFEHPEVKKQADEEGIDTNKIEGAYFSGEIHLVASNMGSFADIERNVLKTLLHEGYGHHGFRNLYKDNVENASKQLYKDFGGEAGLKRLAKRFNLAMDEYFDVAQTKDEDEKPFYIVDEFLAHLQGTDLLTKTDSSVMAPIRRFLAKIRSFLRKIGMPYLGIMSDQETLNLLHDMRQAAKDSPWWFGPPVLAQNKNQGNAGVSFSRAPQTAPNLPAETRTQAAQRELQDRFNRFRVVQDWLSRQGMDIQDRENVYNTETAMHGRTAVRMEDFRRDTLQPLIQDIQQAGFTLEQIADYLHAQHAGERNRQIATINPRFPDGGSGLTNAGAQAKLAQYRGMANFSQFRQLADRMLGITTSTLDILHQAEIVSDTQRQAYEAAYDYYVPLKGVDEETRQGTGQGLNVNGRQQRALGHQQRAEAIIENIVRDHERAIILAEKNRVGQTLINLATKLNDDAIISINKPVQRQVLTQPADVWVADYGNGQSEVFKTRTEAEQAIRLANAASGTVTRRDADPVVQLMAKPQLQDNEAEVWVDGKRVRLQIKDELLARAYRNLGSEHLGRILQLGRGINSWLSKAYTGLNPEFIAVNLLRDASSGIINLTGQHGLKTALQVAAHYPSALKDAFVYATNPAKASQWMRDYRADGGSTGASWLSDLERIGQDIQASYDEYKGAAQLLAEGKPAKATGAAARKLVKGLTGWIEAANAASENAMRLATYRTLIGQGQSRQKAAVAAKTVTLNFNRRGELGQQLSSLYLFFNPSLQGTAAILDATLSATHKKQAQALLGGMALTGLLLAEAFRGAGDDDEEAWQRLPESVKNHNLILKLGDSQQLTLPIPYGYGYLVQLGYALSDLLHGADTQKTALHLASGFLENFLPVGNPIPEGELDSRNLINFLPTIPKMALQPAMNINQWGGPIMPENAFNPAQPDSAKAWRSSKGGAADQVASTLNRLTGGNAYQSGAIDISPETLKYLWSSLTGGSGRFWTDTLGLVANQAQGVDDTELREMPLLRKLTREDSIQDYRQRYQSSLDGARDALAAFKAAKSAHDGTAMQGILARDGELVRMGTLAEQWQTAIKAKRAYIDRLNALDLPLVDKRQRVKAAERDEQALYERFQRIIGQRLSP